jgi:hypothetical protein
MAARVNTAVQATSDEISLLLRKRIAECRAALETLTVHGAQTAEEAADKESLLFEFWALWRALERKP